MKKFKVGQKVYSLAHGWGEVTDLRTDNGEYPVLVKFTSGQSDRFTHGGCLFPNSPQSLFHYEPEIIEPKWHPKEGEWCWFWDNNNSKEAASIMRFSCMHLDKFITTLGVGWTNCAPFPIEHLPEHLK